MKILKIENAKLMWTNFAGEEQPPYNPKGRRNFCVLLPLELAEQMEKDGWPVIMKEPDDPDDDPFCYIRVTVKFKDDRDWNPKIKMITESGETELDSESVKVLDQAIIDHATVKLSPWKWTWGSKTGITTYLKSADVYIKNTSDRRE